MTTQTRRGHETVAQLYDRTTELMEKVMGGSLHYGYWDDPAGDDSMEAASERMTDIMIDRLGAESGHRVLDVGCGTGRPAVRLARAADVEVVGISVSERQIELASGFAAGEGLAGQVRFQVADALDLPFEPETFDGAWLFESLLHMPEPERVLRQISTVLKPGGRLVIANLVQRIPLTDEQLARLEPHYEQFGIRSIVPLRDYPDLVASAMLTLEDVWDVSAHSVPQTLNQILRRITRILEHFQSEDGEVPPPPPFVVRLAETPEIGYAIIVASKPG